MGTEYKNHPFEIKDLDTEETNEILKHFKNSAIDGFVRVGSKEYFFNTGIKELLPKIYNMTLRSDDTWVITFPRSGTTWMQELVWLVANNFDYERAKTIDIASRFPFLELSMLFSTDQTKALIPVDIDENEITKSVDYVSSLPSPRFIKSHLPLSLLPPALLDTSRVVYVARDPRDVAVSNYYLSISFKIVGYSSDFKNYWNLFIKNKVLWAPYFTNLKEAWAKRTHPNLLFFFYEDMKRDLPSVVRKVAKFYGKDISEELTKSMCGHLSFENFKKNKAVNYIELYKHLHFYNKDTEFVRQGKSGRWRDMFDEEMTAQAECWIADNLRDTDLRFPSMS